MMKNEYLYRQYTETYLALRRAVGWIGILLPLTLILGNYLIFQGEIFLSSISRYYYTPMGSVFVGALCADAIFMFFYSGYGKTDRIPAVGAGIFLLGVVIFPTSLDGKIGLVGLLHYICAAGLFLVLSFMSLYNFPRKRPGTPKQVTDSIQIICGLVMLTCVIAAGIYLVLSQVKGLESNFFFFAESVALIAFGVSWLTEGLDLKQEILWIPGEDMRS